MGGHDRTRARARLVGAVVATALLAACSEPTDVEFAESSSDALLTGSLFTSASVALIVLFARGYSRFSRAHDRALAVLSMIGIVCIVPFLILGNLMTLAGTGDLFDLLDRTTDPQARTIAHQGLLFGWGILITSIVCTVIVARVFRPPVNDFIPRPAPIAGPPPAMPAAAPAGPPPRALPPAPINGVRSPPPPPPPVPPPVARRPQSREARRERPLRAAGR